jgi:hypothetical protein
MVKLVASQQNGLAESGLSLQEAKRMSKLLQDLVRLKKCYDKNEFVTDLLLNLIKILIFSPFFLLSKYNPFATE